MTEYIIVGDTERYKDCLVYTCGKNRANAEKVLDRLLHNPAKYESHIVETHTNFRIEEVVEKDQWWNDPFLVN